MCIRDSDRPRLVGGEEDRPGPAALHGQHRAPVRRCARGPGLMTVGQDAARPAPAHRRSAEPGAPAHRTSAVIAVVVGLVGELLITLGVLLGLFVVWQLWWTGVVADRQQAEVVADLGWAVTPDRPAPSPEPSAPEPVHRTDPAPVMAEPAHATTFATLHVPRLSL